MIYGSLTGAPNPPKTSKLPFRTLSQPPQNPLHLRQLVLQPGPRRLIRACIQQLVRLTLHIRPLLRGILLQRLRHELDIEGRLHECRKWISWFGAKGGEEGAGDGFIQGGDDGVR